MNLASYLLTLDEFYFQASNDRPDRTYMSKKRGENDFQLSELGASNGPFHWEQSNFYAKLNAGKFFPVMIPQKKIERLE